MLILDSRRKSSSQEFQFQASTAIARKHSQKRWFNFLTPYWNGIKLENYYFIAKELLKTCKLFHLVFKMKNTLCFIELWGPNRIYLIDFQQK